MILTNGDVVEKSVSMTSLGTIVLSLTYKICKTGKTHNNTLDTYAFFQQYRIQFKKLKRRVELVKNVDTKKTTTSKREIFL